MHSDIITYGKRIEKMEDDAKLKILEGKMVQNLDSVLQRHNVTMQQYHGRSFTGSHCHKYLKEDVYEDICNSVVEETRMSHSDQNIVIEAESIAYRFETATENLQRYTNLCHTQMPSRKERQTSLKIKSTVIAQNIALNTLILFTLNCTS